MRKGGWGLGLGASVCVCVCVVMGGGWIGGGGEGRRRGRRFRRRFLSGPACPASVEHPPGAREHEAWGKLHMAAWRAEAAQRGWAVCMMRSASFCAQHFMLLCAMRLLECCRQGPPHLRRWLLLRGGVPAGPAGEGQAGRRCAAGAGRAGQGARGGGIQHGTGSGTGHIGCSLPWLLHRTLRDLSLPASR